LPFVSTKAGRAALAALLLLTAGCQRSVPRAAFTTTVTDSSGIPIITLVRPLADVALGRAGAANDSGTLLFERDSLEHPVAAAFLPSGEVAVLDRNDFSLTLLDRSGKVLAILGRKGDGPGEFRLPAAVAAVGSDLVVLQSFPGNMLVGFPKGNIPNSVTPEAPGDWNGWMFQQPDLGIEFRDQSAPEVWSRRLRALDDSSFVVYLGPTNEDTATGARAHLLRFGRDLKLRDTILAFPAGHRESRSNPDGRGAPQLFTPVWGNRAVWTAGEGAIATARSDGSRVEVRSARGDLQVVVRWRADSSPVTPDDRRDLGAYILRVTLSASAEAAAMKSKMSDAQVEEMMDQFVARFELAPTRPELVTLFLADRCLWMAGFDAHDDADGTAHEWVAIDLEHPGSSPKVVTIGGPTERVVAIERGKAATIRLDEDGFRRVRVYRVPGCSAA
jgi:hypothetical protein